MTTPPSRDPHNDPTAYQYGLGEDPYRQSHHAAHDSEPNASGSASRRPGYGQPAPGQEATGHDPYQGAYAPLDRAAVGAGSTVGPHLAHVAADQVCPRHPDRPSGVRCQRCGRPACPECRISAAVGVQCVDCVREAEAHYRATMPRTVVGAAPVTAAPVVTYAIMELAGGIFALQMLGFERVLFNYLGFVPVISLSLPWTFITSGFLHGGLVHLALNLYGLWIIGQFLERVLGHWRFALTFLLSVIGGHVAVLVLALPLTDSWATLTVGASGGLFGLFGALLIVQRKMGGQAAQVFVLIAANLAFSFLYPNISWQGHLGGLITGIITALLLFAFRPKRTPGADRAALAKKSALMHGAVFAAVFALLLGVIAAKVALSPGAFIGSIYGI